MPYTSEQLDLARDILQKLFSIVKDEESTLAGGKKLGMGADALNELLGTKITFGNPLAEFNSLPINLEVPSEEFRYYYMVLPVSMKPGRGVTFRRIECLLKFECTDQRKPIILSIFPTSKWHDVLKWGGELQLRLGQDLNWIMSIFPNSNIESIPSSIKSLLERTGKINSFIEIPRFSFDVGRAEIVATGEGDNECFWRIEKPFIQEVYTYKFAIVFKVPKTMSSIKLTGIIIGEPDFSWLTNSLRDVKDYLEKRWREFLEINDESRSASERLPVGDHETWKLTLP